MAKKSGEGPLILGGALKGSNDDTPGMVPEPETLAAPVEMPQVAEAQAEPVAEPPRPRDAVQHDPVLSPPSRPAPTPARRSGFGGTVLGGMIAAGLGYAGAAYLGDASWPFRATDATPVADTTALEAEVQRMAAELELLKAAPDQIAALKTEVDGVTATIAALPAPQPAPELPDISAPLDAISADVSALSGRLDALEKRPAADGGVSQSAIDAFQRELEALRTEIRAAPAAAPVADPAATEAAAASLREAEAALAAMQEQSVAATNAAAQRAALARLSVGLDMGGDIQGAAAAAGLDPAIFATAPSLADLQRGYPEAARTALAASIRAGADESMTSRFGAFLKSQVSARSLSPQEGSTPDAILSRAEAALASGQVKTALDELAALPAEGANALADWRAGAEAHLAARSALDDATAALPAN